MNITVEDRISALATKDPNKLAVYQQGYDGHCLRSYFYFGHLMPDIEYNVQSINSIEHKYPQWRQESKAPTFLLTYGGTYHGLIQNCGFTEEIAKDIEAKYHKAYKVSDEWVAAHIAEAEHTGYVTCAFGLKVRTPLLHKTIRGTKSTPRLAAEEARTAGNALGQSWGLLTNRAANEVMDKLKSLPYMRESIKPCANIHDAIYYMIRDDVDVVLWLNEHLTKAMKWQEHPAIAHDEVKLYGDLEIFYPDWSKAITLPHELDETKLMEIIHDHK